MTEGFTSQEITETQAILDDLGHGDARQGIQRLRRLIEDVYATIPDKQRQSRGITWVVQRISRMLVETCEDQRQHLETILSLRANLAEDDRTLGVAIFMMAAYGQEQPREAWDFFQGTGASSDWVTREFSAAGLHKLISFHRELLLPWLQAGARDPNPNLRRMVSEALRPVTDNRWMQDQPDYSLTVLRLMFAESHTYPRTSVGNNLSDLSRHNHELIFSIVEELVGSGDPNSYWIAQRACRNLVKIDPTRVMDLLGVDEYHYKDRHYQRN